MAAGMDAKDVEAIQTAYEAAVQERFVILIDALEEEADETEAQQHFAKGVDICKRAKKLALEALSK